MFLLVPRSSHRLTQLSRLHPTVQIVTLVDLARSIAVHWANDIVVWRSGALFIALHEVEKPHLDVSLASIPLRRFPKAFEDVQRYPKGGDSGIAEDKAALSFTARVVWVSALVTVLPSKTPNNYLPRT